MVILMMGVAGSGKTTIGRMLAQSLCWSFADADDFHPAANITKMAAGSPLDDVDRAPWLAAIRAYIDGCLARGENGVVTCSALKEHYRQMLVSDAAQVKLVYLQGDRELLWSRLSTRRNHFMQPAMLDSQLRALEPPANALAVDISPAPPAIVQKIRQALDI